MQQCDVLIVGASAAGLATAACLKKAKIPFIILERQGGVAHGWRNHYDRLHLHTNKSLSALPYKKFEASLPKYPSRASVVEYLESYRREMGIEPVYNTEVTSVKRDETGWIIATSAQGYHARFVVVATGQTNKPRMAVFKGMESFPGPVLHSSQYKNGEPFRGKNVLVVGFGNSACEQAIDLHEHGAFPSLSVRSAVNVLPRDILGVPILQLGLLMSKVPPAFADKLNAPLIRVIVGNLEKVGLKKSKYGPLEQIQKEKRIPLLDIGTMRLLREGKITAYGNVREINGKAVTFEDGRTMDFEAIILGTGYSNDLEKFVHVDKSRFDDLASGISKQRYFGKDGLYFCGFYISPTGMLREIGLEALQIARDIAGKLK